MPRYRQFLILTLIVSLLASLYICFARFEREQAADRVEIAMDWSDILGVARSYDYNVKAMLVAMRRAGLTSLAVSEELGSAINSGREATVTSGQALIDQGRSGGVQDPFLEKLLKHNRVDPNAVYLTVFSRPAEDRYLAQLHLHFSPKSIDIVRADMPAIIAVRTQIDYLSSLGLGLPADPLQIARDLHLFLIPRLQNDERFGEPQIHAEFASFLKHERVSTVVFFGIRNQVLGFPDHLKDTAGVFRATHLNYGSIEAYDNSQLQKGNEELARDMIGQTVRVQAISKTELDKLDFETVVGRFLLGAHERNIRVIYLHPLLHQNGAMSLQATNIELIRRLSAGLAQRGLHLGRATPIPAFRVNPLVVLIATLAAPAAFLLLWDLLGVALPLPAVILSFAADIALFSAGCVIHHEELAAKIIALCGAICFAVLSVVVLRSRFVAPDIPVDYVGALTEGIVCLATGTGVALAGALLVVGLVSNPLTMEEIDRFSGVKAILLLPPVLVLAAYLCSPNLRTRVYSWREIVGEPVRVYQLLLAVVLVAAGGLYLARSGNQSDIAPSALELALRSKLTVLLSVRPRFKEFLLGFPALVMLPSLSPLHRRRAGWLFALIASIGLADSIDTFSHLHTPLLVSLLRLVNGLVIGIVIGAVGIALYRRTRITPEHFEVAP